jgi:hypothetical protein
MAVFLLIGKTSALTMNVAGVVKDWLLIFLSVFVYGCAQAPSPDMHVRAASACTGCQGSVLGLA